MGTGKKKREEKNKASWAAGILDPPFYDREFAEAESVPKTMRFH